jgi:hypothetical protein
MHGMHTVAEITQMFDDELARLLADPNNAADAEIFREARAQSEAMIRHAYHDPI